MWGADFPHSEGTAPYSVESLRAELADLPEAEIETLVAIRAARCTASISTRSSRSPTRSAPRWRRSRRPSAPANGLVSRRDLLFRLPGPRGLTLDPGTKGSGGRLPHRTGSRYADFDAIQIRRRWVRRPRRRARGCQMDENDHRLIRLARRDPEGALARVPRPASSTTCSPALHARTTRSTRRPSSC